MSLNRKGYKPNSVNITPKQILKNLGMNEDRIEEVTKGKVRLNIGCGLKSFKDYINIDLYPHENVDIVMDFNNLPTKFPDNFFDLIYSDNTLEHLSADIKDIIKEHVRICKDGGRIIIIVPHHTNSANFCPFHHHQFYYNAFNNRYGKGSYSLEVGYEYKNLEIIKRKIMFHKKLFWNWIIEPLMNISIMPMIYENTFLKSLFPAEDIYFELKVNKYKNIPSVKSVFTKPCRK